MSDLQRGGQIYERHPDLHTLHIQKTIIEEISLIKALELKKEQIMSVEFAKIDFEIECRKKCIYELKTKIKEGFKCQIQ